MTSRQQPCSHYSVIGLQLRAGNLTGQLDSVMEELQALHQLGLTTLDLSRNQLTGTLPSALGQMTRLQALLFGANNFTGSVPASTASLKLLNQLDLEFNFLGGQLSSNQLCPVDNRLNALMLRANNFTGPLDLSNCRNLTVVDLQDNGFTGSIPVGAPNRFLHVVRARNNKFTGQVPDELWELPQLITVDFSNNSLTGTLAENIGTTSFLTNLMLGSNNLRGTIPLNMTTSSQLTNVDLSNNAWIRGAIPSFRWMLGLQALDLSNTRISGKIPSELGALPFLMSVDLRNTLMTCCHNLSEAEAQAKLYQQRNSTELHGDPSPAPDLLPRFLQFNQANMRSPVDEPMPRDNLLAQYMATGADLMCPTVMRTPNTNPGSSTVYRPANLTTQQWHLDPEYFWFMNCSCAQPNQDLVRDNSKLTELWCNDGEDWVPQVGPPAPSNKSRTCVQMSLQVCQPRSKSVLSTWQYVLISLAALAILCVMIMLASLFLSLCIARTGKVRRQLEWWKKHLSGMPQHGKMSIVVTDIEGYSDLFKRCPEPMYEALTLHNNVIRRAKYANCGSTVQQEGDSYTLVFHEPLDAAAFCLQAQLALMEVPWPEGLYDDSSQHQGQYNKPGSRTRSKGRNKLGGDSSRKASAVTALLPSATSSWLKRTKPGLRHTTSTGSLGVPGPTSPPSPTASENLGCNPASSMAGELVALNPPAVQPSSSMAWPRSQHMSRARMMELFSRVTGSGGGTSEAGLFNGLRVRMGVVTGVVEGSPEPSAPSANIMNSTLYKLALDVSDAGSGGQVLMDEVTFSKVKEDLRPLGAVGPNGINYHKLAERVSLFHLLCLGSLFSRRSRYLDVDEAMVLDMGQYVVPGGGTADKKPPGATPPNLAGMLKRASMKLAGWGHGIESNANHSNISTLPEAEAQSPPSSPALASTPPRDPPWHTSRQAVSPLFEFPTLPAAMNGGSGAGSSHPTGWGSPDVTPAAGPAGTGDAASGLRSSWAGAAGSSSAGPLQKRVRLIQVLSPSLVGRAHVWGNKLAIRGTWSCVDAPYFEAPGALEAPLGPAMPNRAFSLNRNTGDGGRQASGMSVTPGSNSFVSVVGSQHSSSQLSQVASQQPVMQQQQQQQLLEEQGRGSLEGKSREAQQVGQQQEPQQQQQQQLEQAAAESSHDCSFVLPAGAGAAASLPLLGSNSSRGFTAWPSIQEEACLSCQQRIEHQQQQQQGSQLTQQGQQQQLELSISSCGPLTDTAAADAASQPQPNAVISESAAAAAAAAAAAVRLLRQPIPAVTMVFMLVEGAKVFGQRRKQLVKDVHAQLSQLLMLALKHVPGGYMCRMQEGDLKYMVAFSSAPAALEWCLLVQEASMYLNWPAGLSKVPQLRSEYDSNNQLVFRGPRIKMGVCEGVPQSIIPNHEGRADYHGSSINQAARYMDAAAHGGQIACELDLALAVVQRWNGTHLRCNTAPAGTSEAAAAAAAAAASGSAADAQELAQDSLGVLSAPEAVLAACGGTAAAAAAGGRAGSAVAARCSSADRGPERPQPATLMSLDSSVGRWQLEEQQQQREQVQEGAFVQHVSRLQRQGDLTAAPSIAAADDSGLVPAAAAATAVAAVSSTGDTGAAAVLVAVEAGVDAAAVPGAPAAPSSRSSFFFGSSTAEAGSSSSGSRFPWFFKSGGQSQSISNTFQGPTNTSASQAAAAAAAAAAVAAAAMEVEQAPRLFQLPQDEVERAPVAVQVYHLGRFKFKGNPQPLPMVNVTLASLAGRLPLLPTDPPKGKGGRVEAKDGLVANCEANLAVLAQEYRARVPSHILEHVEYIPAVHPAMPPSPRRQISAALRAASMPTRSYSHRNRSPSLQQRPRQQDLQLSAMEGGLGLVGTHSGPSSPMPSPLPMSASARSSSFTARLFSKQKLGGLQNGMDDRLAGAAAAGDTLQYRRSADGGAVTAGGGGGSSKSGGPGDVVLEMRPRSALA